MVNVTIEVPFAIVNDGSFIETDLKNKRPTPSHVIEYVISEMSSLLFLFNNRIVWGKPETRRRGEAR